MKKGVRSHKVLYGVNTSVKYLKSDGKNKNYIYVQHKHQDYEVRIIRKGEGSCFIGEQVVEFKEGDIFFIGRNVPHCSTMYETKKQSEEWIKSDILYFQAALFPLKINELPDFIHINNLLSKSQNGVMFRNRTLYKKVMPIIERIDSSTGIQRVNELFYFLDLLGRNKHSQLISKSRFEVQNSLQVGNETLQKTYDYLYNNLKNEITLDGIANYVNLNPAALCRSFKRKTGVTLFQFLNKIRIENACKLLTYTELNVSQVAYESGFNNMPHFNQQFKLITNLSPTEYRKHISRDE